MSLKERKILLPLLLATVALTAVVVFAARSAVKRNRRASPQVFQPSFLLPSQRAATAAGTVHRNLALQPIAFNLARRLGSRFSAGRRVKAETTGTLTIGAEQRTMNMARQQTDKGERIQIGFVGTNETLTWDANEGTKLSGGEASESQRELMEKLVLDSPDQFVLAQLRGASYSTIARNVGPDKAQADYAGPTWTIVRVDDPESDELKRPRSRWRLYYLNTRTGLIDRITSEINGQKIDAELTWINVAGESVPARIKWTRDGQAVMGYQLLSFSHADQGGVR